MRLTAMSLVLSLIPFTTILSAQDPVTSIPSREYQAILRDYEASRRDASNKYDAATTDEERRRIRASFPLPENCYQRLLDLAEASPRDAASVDALVWIVATSTNGYDAFKERGPRIQRAMDLLVGKHLDDPRVGRVCLELGGATTPLRDEFLHRVYSKATNREVKGRACLGLGEFLLSKSETVSYLKGPDGAELMRDSTASFSHRLPYYEQLLRENPAALALEAEQLLGRAATDYGDLPFDPTFSTKPKKTIAEVARNDLRRHHNLEVGQQAPEIEGQDTEGTRFKLSDYRGRVVLLTFSGNWCGPCRAMYPQERSLVERFKGRPFVILSVNTDEDKNTLRKSIDQREILWRCWWESGVEGPICSQWLVQSFPQVYLLDHKGVIRSHGLSASGRELEELVQAVESEARASK